MRWRRRRSVRLLERNHVERVPDGDRVLGAGQRHWRDLLQPVGSPLEEPTRPLPLLAPLLTRAAEWRSRGGRR